MPITEDNPTLLVIAPVGPATGFEVQPYGARGITQTLEPIAAQGSLGQTFRRTINGGLIDLSTPAFRKYRSTISCTDYDTPCLDDAWLGQIVTVDCIPELSYPIGSTRGRPAVSGSEHGVSGGPTYYRPQLTMMVVGIRNSRDEYASTYAWQIDLEEV